MFANVEQCTAIRAASTSPVLWPGIESNYSECSTLQFLSLLWLVVCFRVCVFNYVFTVSCVGKTRKQHFDCYLQFRFYGWAYISKTKRLWWWK